MNLIDINIKDYLNILNSKAPAPGGGAVCALTGAQGAALIGMVADLTIGKKKYEEYDDLCKWAKGEADILVEKFMKAADDDAAAYTMVSKAYALPKDTENEKAERARLIAETSIEAAKVPFDTLVLCIEGLKLTEKLLGKSNQSAVSDLGVAALNFMAAAKSAWLNVKINMGSIVDEEILKKLGEAEAMAEDVSVQAKKIYEAVEEVL